MRQPLPPDSTMVELLGLRGNDTKIADDGLFYLVIGDEEHAIPAESLADLEGRGWIEVDDERIKVTPRGEYWLERWSLKTFKRRDLKLTSGADHSYSNPTHGNVSHLFK